MKRFFQWLRQIPINLVVFLLGLGLASVGMYAVFPPAGLIFAGVILMGISLFGDQRP